QEITELTEILNFSVNSVTSCFNSLNSCLKSPLHRHLLYPFDDDLGDLRCGSDGGRVPDEFPFSFGWISPGRLAGGEALLDGAFGFTEQHGNILPRMHAVADEKWNHHDVLRLRQLAAPGNARLFFDEYRMHGRILVERADGFDLSVDGDARVLVLFGSVAGDEQGDFLRRRRTRKRKFFDNAAGACQQHFGH